MNISIYDVYGYIAGVIMALGMFPYVRSIVKTKETKLNQASWLIWSALGITNLISYFLSGEKETIRYVAVAAVNPVIIYLLSLKYGIKEWTRTDKQCVKAAAVAVVCILIGQPFLALIAGITGDALGLYPTYLKVKKEPLSENLTGWWMLLLASTFNIFAVKEWTLANGCYTLYAIIASVLIVVYVVKGKIYFIAAASR